MNLQKQISSWIFVSVYEISVLHVLSHCHSIVAPVVSVYHCSSPYIKHSASCQERVSCIAERLLKKDVESIELSVVLCLLHFSLLPKIVFQEDQYLTVELYLLVLMMHHD